MGPGQGGEGGSVLGGKTLVSTNDICNIILSGAARLGRDSLLKYGRGSDGGIYGKACRRKKKKSKAAEDVGRRSWLRGIVNLGDSYISKLLSLIKNIQDSFAALTRMMWQNCIT